MILSTIYAVVEKQNTLALNNKMYDIHRIISIISYRLAVSGRRF